MNEEAFWSLIDASQQSAQGNPEKQIRALSKALSVLSEEELCAFDAVYREHLEKAHHWDLWAAAYIINGGCSEDGFDYFKDWLISRGKDVYTRALENPEILIDVATPYDTEFEEFRYVVQEVFEKKCGKEMPYDIKQPAAIQGEEWDEDTVEEEFPRLAEWVQRYKPSLLAYSKKPSFWQRLFGK